MANQKCDESCPLCKENRTGRGNHKGHKGYRPVGRVGESFYGFKKRATQGPIADAAPGTPPNHRVEGDFPALVGWMWDTAYADQTPRVPGRFSLFAEDGRLKACIADKDGHYVAFVAAGSFQELLCRIEEGLAGDTLEWRKEKPWGQQRR